MTMPIRRFRIDADYETSTIVCPCGSSFTWSGYSEDLQPWKIKHAAHVDPETQPEQVITEDGMRAYK